MERIKVARHTRKILKTRFYGTGSLGYFTEGDMEKIKLRKDDTIFVQIPYVVGYSTDIKYEIRWYGDGIINEFILPIPLHYEFTGPGTVYLQTQSIAASLQNAAAQKDTWVDVVIDQFPGGDIINKIRPK